MTDPRKMTMERSELNSRLVSHANAIDPPYLSRIPGGVLGFKWDVVAELMREKKVDPVKTVREYVLQLAKEIGDRGQILPAQYVREAIGLYDDIRRDGNAERGHGITFKGNEISPHLMSINPVFIDMLWNAIPTIIRGTTPKEYYGVIEDELNMIWK